MVSGLRLQMTNGDTSMRSPVALLQANALLQGWRQDEMSLAIGE
jgi:hypothetical protein